MGQIIQAAELQTGDLYRQYSSLVGVVIRRVTGRRTVKTAETYEVLTTEALDGGQRGEISLRADVTVERLESVNLMDLAGSMRYASVGEQFNVVYANGGHFNYPGFWC